MSSKNNTFQAQFFFVLQRLKLNKYRFTQFSLHSSYKLKFRLRMIQILLQLGNKMSKLYAQKNVEFNFLFNKYGFLNGNISILFEQVLRNSLFVGD